MVYVFFVPFSFSQKLIFPKKDFPGKGHGWPKRSVLVFFNVFFVLLVLAGIIQCSFQSVECEMPISESYLVCLLKMHISGLLLRFTESGVLGIEFGDVHF